MAVLTTPFFAQLVSAANPGPVTLASASDGRTVKLGDVASDDLIVVGFQERNVSYVRWSKNGGQSFASRVALHDGLPATDPRVATCNDDSVFAVSSWPTATGTEIGLDFRNFVTRDVGSYSLGAGSMADVACYGDVGAVTWVADGHLWLATQTSDCPNPCALNLKLDLGAGDFTSPPRITQDYGGFSVAWLTTGLTIEHFDYDAGSGGNYSLTPKPTLTLMAGKGVRYPVISGLGDRLVVAYQRAGRTQIRISDDVASSFGPRILVPGKCSGCANGGPRPDSVAISGSNILVEVSRAAGSPLSYAMNGFLTRDSGATWTKVSSRTGGSQHGVIIEAAYYAEVWDHDHSSKPNQYIRFQMAHL